MTATTLTLPIPLQRDPSGKIRVADTRIPYERVIESYEFGSTPEDIVRQYDVLELADVYAVLAYFLRNRAEFEEYRAEREKVAEAARRAG